MSFKTNNTSENVLIDLEFIGIPLNCHLVYFVNFDDVV